MRDLLFWDPIYDLSSFRSSQICYHPLGVRIFSLACMLSRRLIWLSKKRRFLEFLMDLYTAFPAIPVLQLFYDYLLYQICLRECVCVRVILWFISFSKWVYLWCWECMGIRCIGKWSSSFFFLCFVKINQFLEICSTLCEFGTDLFKCVFYVFLLSILPFYSCVCAVFDSCTYTICSRSIT